MFELSKKSFAIAASLFLISVNAYALEAITCSESLDEDLLPVGDTDIGLSSEKDGSANAKDWVLSVGGKAHKIGKFKKLDTGYQVTTITSAAANVGVIYTFKLEGCDKGKGSLEVKQLGGFAGGTVTQKLVCGCGTE